MPPLGPPRMGECRDGREGSRKVRCPCANRTMDVQKRSLHSPFCFPTCKVAQGSCFSENGFVHTEFLLAQGLLSYQNQEYKRPAVGLFPSSSLCAVLFIRFFTSPSPTCFYLCSDQTPTRSWSHNRCDHKNNSQGGVLYQVANTDRGVCINCISVVVIEYHGQKQLKESFILAYSFRKLESIMAGMIGHGSRN